MERSPETESLDRVNQAKTLTACSTSSSGLRDSAFGSGPPCADVCLCPCCGGQQHSMVRHMPYLISQFHQAASSSWAVIGRGITRARKKKDLVSASLMHVCCASLRAAGTYQLDQGPARSALGPLCATLRIWRGGGALQQMERFKSSRGVSKVD